MESPQISYFEVSTMDGAAAFQAAKDKVAAEMRERIESETGKTNIRFSFRHLTEPRPGPVMNHRWEARAEFYCSRMESPQINYFEVSTIDSAATLQAMKDKVAAKMRENIEQETGQTNISFTFRNLTESNPAPIVSDRWEARAEF